MNSPIDRLEQELWFSCVIQRHPKDQETINRWQTDEISHLKERFYVQPMPSSLNGLVQSALVQWQQIETKVCSNLGMTREQFLKEFEEAREDFLNNGIKWDKAIYSMQNAVYGAVRNMDWVNLFAWVLPLADTEFLVKHREIGRMVTAIFYIELLSKCGFDDDNLYLRNIEARWRLVNQL